MRNSQGEITDVVLLGTICVIVLLVYVWLTSRRPQYPYRFHYEQGNYLQENLQEDQGDKWISSPVNFHDQQTWSDPSRHCENQEAFGDSPLNLQEWNFPPLSSQVHPKTSASKLDWSRLDFTGSTKQERKLSSKRSRPVIRVVEPPSRLPSIFLKRRGGEVSIPEIDLHGLLVEDAIQQTKDFLSLYHNRKEIEKLHIITGRGVHSDDGAPRIKPAIFRFLKVQQCNFSETYDGGCFVVYNERKKMAGY